MASSLTTDEEIPNDPLIHICEGCGKEEILTPEEGYEQGWDYPPKWFPFGIVSPRTCGSCGIEKTLYWRLLIAQRDGVQYQATEEDKVLLDRITNEPTSITPNKEKQ